MDKSQECFRKAATINGWRPALRWRQLGFAPVCFQSTDAIDEYWRRLDSALDVAIAERTRFDWRSLPSEGCIPPFQLAHFGKCCRAIKEKFARLYAPSFDRVCRSRSRARFDGKIRVGFFVAPLEVGGFVRSMSGVIKQMDSDRFESLVFHRPESSAFLRRAISGATLVDVSDVFETAVERMRETACDAIHYWKVGGSTWNYFMPMLRLAPVQSLAWGGHGTSGVFDVDYYLSYKNAELANAQESYTEKLVLLDEMPAYRSFYRSSVASSREELRLPSSGALYFCPHRLAKYHPEFDEYLKGVLASDPSGFIMATLGERDDFESEQIRARIERNLGPTLAKRIIFLPRLSRREYDRFLSTSTVELDSFVYSSCLTLYDALSFGVPCVAQIGELLVQRFTATAYSDMGIENAPIAKNREEYVRTEVELERIPITVALCLSRFSNAEVTSSNARIARMNLNVFGNAPSTTFNEQRDRRLPWAFGVDYGGVSSLSSIS